MLFAQKKRKAGKDLVTFRSAARHFTHQKESPSALPKAKESLINRIWYNNNQHREILHTNKSERSFYLKSAHEVCNTVETWA